MATEKDRLGNKLRDAERAREDQYFAERDRQLIDRLRESKEGETAGTRRRQPRSRRRHTCVAPSAAPR